ncbi:glyoxalase [Microbacterium aurum]|uniref:Glyoxalase n=1 Tax=Microbacterium aurum TaxID=36805 RepID=A0A1P8U9I1_9MICO|nr:VOC family protein [Microbacterium aurum]APZ34760.1 glyoxalase [Microbacterium aurum]MBM7828666.1 putative glyoxalase superfamily protein PhnB [Microbacterium aurum]
MFVTSLYPVLMSGDVGAAASFYRDLIGFETTFESDWYVSLRLGEFELAIVAHDHSTVPAGYRELPRGVIVNLEVRDVDAVHTRLCSRTEVNVVLPVRDEDFGQRHFIVAAPDGVLLDIIQPVTPSEDYASAYVQP